MMPHRTGTPLRHGEEPSDPYVPSSSPTSPHIVPGSSAGRCSFPPLALPEGDSLALEASRGVSRTMPLVEGAQRAPGEIDEDGISELDTGRGSEGCRLPSCLTGSGRDEDASRPFAGWQGAASFESCSSAYGAEGDAAWRRPHHFPAAAEPRSRVTHTAPGTAMQDDPADLRSPRQGPRHVLRGRFRHVQDSP